LQNAELKSFMPSGKTHDTITIILAAPAFAVGYAVTRDIGLAAVIAFGFLFGGLMFGPDLDTTSKQFARWSFMKVLWFPYRIFFTHRSRWSHGLIFGSLIRVVYFIGVVTIAAFIGAFALALISDGLPPDIVDLARSWRTIGGYTSMTFLFSLFCGLWAGAASHTLTDMAGTFIKTGRVTEFL
jgi:uncharacterized metal-binding protein